MKLAVITLGTLAATLAYATFFESVVRHGGRRTSTSIAVPASRSCSPSWASNILCAALIRYPWKKRQTGFVITHAGLLIMLAGSYYSVRTSDEGQVGMLEGDVKGELVRIDYPVIQVWEVDPHTQQYLRECDLPFLPGAFPWGPGQPQPRGRRRAACLDWLTLGLAGATPTTEEVLTKPGDPFRLVVKEHLPASAPAREHVDDPEGTPMARIRLRFKAPGMPQEQDAFPSEDEPVVRDGADVLPGRPEPMRGAPALVTFSAVDRPELVEDFLKPPAAAGKDGVARFRYAGSSRASAQVFDWPLDGQAGEVGRAAGQRPDGHAREVMPVAAPAVPAESHAWARTRSRSRCSRSGEVAASRPPTWRWRTCRCSRT